MISRWIAIAALGATAVSASAQSPRSVIIRVRVVDTARSPIEDVQLSLVSGLRDVLASVSTDQLGRHHFDLAEGAEELQIVARRVGYERVARVFPAQRDTVDIELIMHRLVRQLDTVRVTAEASAYRARTFVDADDIAAAERPLFDAIDVIEKLRPDMLHEPPDYTGQCDPLQNIWINGKRVEWRLPGGAHVIMSPQRAMAIATTARPKGALRGAGEGPIAVLALLRPEHIASIEYRDCRHNAIDRQGGTSALFIVLKDGVAYDRTEGSYVLSETAADSVLKSIQRRPP